MGCSRGWGGLGVIETSKITKECPPITTMPTDRSTESLRLEKPHSQAPHLHSSPSPLGTGTAPHPCAAQSAAQPLLWSRNLS